MQNRTTAFYLVQQKLNIDFTLRCTHNSSSYTVHVWKGFLTAAESVNNRIYKKPEL